MRKKVLKKPQKNPRIVSAIEKDTVQTHGYLGKKGYTIPKEHICNEELQYLYEELKVSPEIHGASYGMPQEQVSFPVYRENAKKIYVPRFYGIERYGLPRRSEIQQGEDIDVTFSKPLRDYQEKIVDIYCDHVSKSIAQDDENRGGGGILEVPCGRGKCLGKDTLVMKHDGCFEKVQNINVGDYLMGDDSKPRKVNSIARGMETLYKVHTDNGYYVVNESHILSLKCVRKYGIYEKGTIIDICIKDLLKYPKNVYSGTYPPLCGYRVGLQFPRKPVKDDPYMVGHLWKTEIHEDYIKNAFALRCEVLAGVLDAVATNHGCYYTIWTDNDQKKDQLVYLIRSLALNCVTQYHENYQNWSLEIYGPLLGKIPVRMIGHVNPVETEYDHLSYNIRLEEIGKDNYYGFEIDGNRRFVLGDFSVTHNTVMALKIVSLLQKKTLIIVHKEFLMNQWIERANEFLPGVKIGKIQGSTFDVENKDIVLGMLQTLYDKAFPENAFSCFGLTIVDEVHRIGSEQFSKTLLRTITPMMLGISATVDRKDKLTKVLYMFIGPKIYSEEREDDDPVCVRALEYISSDPEFNETLYDFRGQAKYSSMITKLCDFNRRSDFILKVLEDLIEESTTLETNAQIMVLSHNKSLLKYLFEGIQHRNFATVGYYVGGMKQTALLETEGKQIVLATYAMAAEALDIKSLSILLMATPKTDITQSVGRILRVKHKSPIVVDIVDRHEVFQNQWNQRKRFYKKCNYVIYYKDSTQYKNMVCDWKNDKTWKLVYQPGFKGQREKKEEPERKCLIENANLMFEEGDEEK